MEKRQIKIVSIIMSIALLIVGMAFVLSNNVESRASNTNENVTPHSSSAYIVCSAKDQLTESFEGDVSRADADGMVTIVSTIQFYIPEAPRDCRVEGKLIDATTEKPLHDDAGNEFTSTISFTAANVNGNAIIMYKAPAALVAGKTIATTEKLFYDDVEIDSCDLNAPLCNQVRYPDIEVSTLDGNTGEHVGLAANNASLNVVVQYNNVNYPALQRSRVAEGGASVACCKLL